MTFVSLHNLEMWADPRPFLKATMSGKSPPPLRMMIYGEGGTRKSKVIQTVSNLFEQKGHVICITENSLYRNCGIVDRRQDDAHLNRNVRSEKGKDVRRS
jgi:hypothetical protein